MAGFMDFMFGGQKPIGSASDVQMVNGDNYNNFMKMLFGQNLNNPGSSADTALSSLYTSGRDQAQAAADQARRTAANSMANSGLLNSGAAIKSITEATANPMLQMETNLAGQRANYIQNMMGLGAQLNQPEYWQPQYQKTPGFMDVLTTLAPIIGTAVGGPEAGSAVGWLTKLLNGGKSAQPGTAAPAASQFGGGALSFNATRPQGSWMDAWGTP